MVNYFLDVGLSSEYVSEDSNPLLIFLKSKTADLSSNEALTGTFLKYIILILSDRHFP